MNLNSRKLKVIMLLASDQNGYESDCSLGGSVRATRKLGADIHVAVAADSRG